MKFIMGDVLGFGIVGFMYYNTTGYILSRIILFALAVLAVIGFIAVLGFIFGGGFKFKFRKSQREKERDWIRTGKF